MKFPRYIISHLPIPFVIAEMRVQISVSSMLEKRRVFLLLPVVISPLLHTNLSSRLGTTAQFVAAVLSHSTTTTNYFLPYVEVSSVFCISSFYIPSLDSANKVQTHVKPNS